MMEKTLTLPRLGETMEEGTVLAWSKISGEEYDRGDILLELETDKMVVEVPALEDGKILERGNHQELIKQGGNYAQLYQLQTID